MNLVQGAYCMILLTSTGALASGTFKSLSAHATIVLARSLDTTLTQKNGAQASVNGDTF